MALKRQDSYFAIFYNMTREKCALFCLLETRDTCMSFSYSESRQVSFLGSEYVSSHPNSMANPEGEVRLSGILLPKNVTIERVGKGFKKW